MATNKAAEEASVSGLDRAWAAMKTTAITRVHSSGRLRRQTSGKPTATAQPSCSGQDGGGPSGKLPMLFDRMTLSRAAAAIDRPRYRSRRRCRGVGSARTHGSGQSSPGAGVRGTSSSGARAAVT